MGEVKRERQGGRVRVLLVPVVVVVVVVVLYGARKRKFLLSKGRQRHTRDASKLQGQMSTFPRCQLLENSRENDWSLRKLQRMSATSPILLRLLVAQLTTDMQREHTQRY